MAEKIEPALTSKEWLEENLLGPRSDSDLTFDDDGTVTTNLPLLLHIRARASAREVRLSHALAAALLHGQPFGFTAK